MAFTLSVSQSPGGKPTAVRVAEVVRKGDPRAPGPLPLLALHCAWPQSRVSVLISCLFLLYLVTGTCAPPPFSISSVMSRKQPEPHLTPRRQRERVNHRAGPKGEGPPDSSSGLWWSGAARGAGGASSLAPALSSPAGASPRSAPAPGQCGRLGSMGREQVRSESGGQMEVSHPALKHHLLVLLSPLCGWQNRGSG